ncbi:glutamyl-tRNA reductase [Salisaeta longa]|uniref:glutamyl-tRNA reductase n=1 Tax=Salisaeta longa TaxID=503170 RepID=UPI0003B46D83|nr:glutamyl-tRNA reductase [Salisaeta longa]
MTFYAFGLNHEHSTVASTEAFALSSDEQDALYRMLDLSANAEVVLLSTCNRTEVYLYGTADDVSRVQHALSARAMMRWPNDAFLLEDEAAVQHILHVASGIKSMVLGDGQILAQVKDAYQRAVAADAVDTLLHRLMHTAFRAAKRVANETALSSGAASVSTAAVAMALDHFDETATHDLQGRHVLLVGAGQMGRLALSAVRKQAPASITITNRSPERAEALAAAVEADTCPWAARHAAVEAADMVIVATGAPEPVLHAHLLPERAGTDTATLLVDIAMPRNIDPAIDARAGYRVLDLDDLNAWTQRVRAERATELPKARALCDELVGDYVTWVFHQQALQPAIQSIRDTFEHIRQQEMQRHAHDKGMSRDAVDRLTRSIMQKLLAVPVVHLKNVDPDSIDFVRGIKLLHALFARQTGDEAPQLDRKPSEHQPRLDDAPGPCPFGEQSAQPPRIELLNEALQPSVSSS